MRLTTINNLLLGLIILVNGFVIGAPLVPAISFALASLSGRRQELSARIQPDRAAAGPARPGGDRQGPNQLTIPALLLDQPVLEGADSYAVLGKGIWRLPTGSTPDKGGNTVLLGHRFTYSQPKGVFYYLDTLKTGDQIGVRWDNRRYLYTVISTRIVRPTETSIQAATADARLTIYTCTPLLWPKDRLVITAALADQPRVGSL